MKLKILTPTETKFKGEILALNIKTLSGEITILDDHEPMISMFEKGTAHITDKQNQRTAIQIGAGFLEVTPENELNVLTD
ncbi:MAG: hypothetical protein A3B23_01575 [Candidatus Colwellbacteria bacterium RIFCSPLOWO2_01_FULL_48_10]|uniref:ATP synthase F1 complex delta/epsilon subunit N-terminal domain-containing protein n=2 Tax=Bacteria candidate phyla TaxID=1783234 RepID=A0A1F5NZG6_9BACT|nr:MAG: hypothetical protein A2846_01805 [Candidatus Doudnabacteria bacterium RIFCSPHIGHO2_01_FULL_49_9]OGY60362.1 MAG: hypothetical protein A3B23_01575 [Candidatus Colwellbacteria bacterium RIFCSPLOWO2_01_FULL_48_10]